MLSLIYARSENHCIGKAGRIPWRLPDDFAHFKRTTMGRPIIMGRKTYEDHESALPGRLNLVVTRNPAYRPAQGVGVCGSLEDALTLARRESDEVFVIGGVRLFERAMPIADRVYETVVHTEVDGDTFLPAFDFTGWESILLENHPADGRHAYAFTVWRHDRRQVAREQIIDG
ncbi:MAG: dihydrofolate reductase [Planctomycetota bacterium]